MSKLKGTIDGMVATAAVKIDSRIAAIEKEILQVKDTADRNKDCGLDSDSGFWDGFLVGFSLGIKCAVTETTRQKALTFKHRFEKESLELTTGVKPLVYKLQGLSDVAKTVWETAFDKRDDIRTFESALGRAVDNFTERDGSTLDIEYADLRAEMQDELDELITYCDTAMSQTTAKEAVFRSIITNINKEGNRIALMQLYKTQATSTVLALV
jgi:hypothetical protein